MRPVSKIQIFLGVISLVLIVNVALRENSFYRDSVKKKWSPLSWNDFQGIPQPLSKYIATIYSYIRLEKDSVSNQVVAFAIMDNMKSWQKFSDTLDQDYVLKHEQYHFNITEVYARKLNNFIKNNPDLDLAYYTEELNKMSDRLRIIQTNYDKETNHGANLKEQNLWEYKVDSLLDAYSESAEYYLKDSILNFSIKFPVATELTEKYDSINNQYYYQHFVEKYGIKFDVKSFYVKNHNIVEAHERAQAFIDGNSSKILMLQTSTDDSYKITFSEYVNYGGTGIARLTWVESLDWFHVITTIYPIDYQYDNTFRKITENFHNSFEFQISSKRTK